MKSNIIISPSVNSEWNTFVKQNPDVTAMRDWVLNHWNDMKIPQEYLDEPCDHRNDWPEDIFSFSKLSKWAEENGYKNKVSGFSVTEILEYIEEKLRVI